MFPISSAAADRPRIRIFDNHPDNDCHLSAASALRSLIPLGNPGQSPAQRPRSASVSWEVNP